jgi:hypothetical protein
MANETSISNERGFLDAVLSGYSALIALARPGSRSEPGLGGLLLYAGELSTMHRALVVAANVAGAATLAASADQQAQRQATRDGVVDFAVTTLDEALRILKNQVRKGEPVAVCVGLAPEAVEREMGERGVAPDLIAGDLGEKFSARAGRVAPQAASGSEATVRWSVASEPARWLPALDGWALDCLDADAWAERRWLRLAPRFVGRMARGTRVLRCEPAAAEMFLKRVELADLRCELGAAVEIEIERKGLRERRRFSPAGPPRR